MQEQDKHQAENATPDIDTTEQSKSDSIKSSHEQDQESIVDSNDSEQDNEVTSERDELADAQAEIAKLKDAFLRAKAEEDNVRRRAKNEVANSRKFAVEGFAKEMLSVYDSLKMAVSVELGDDAEDAVKSVREGVEITLKQLQSALAKFSITEIAPEAGDKLDPNLHQAMSIIDSDEVDAGAIVNVIQSGFTLHDRLLRPAMVVVAK